MTRELFNLAELLAAAGIGVFVGGVGVFVATAWMRNDAAEDRAVAADDLAKVAAGLVRMESARQLLPLHPAYQAHTAQFEMIRDDREPEPVEATVPVSELDDLLMPDFVPGQPLPEPDAPACCPGHGGDERCTPEAGYALPCCGDCPDWRPGTDLVPVDAVLVDEPPVTADDLAPIGPAKMPAVSWWGWALLAFASVPVLVVLVLLAVAFLAWLGWDRAGEWRADRRRRRETETVEMELAHPAPVVAYDARHRAPAGRWWWSR